MGGLLPWVQCQPAVSGFCVGNLNVMDVGFEPLHQRPEAELKRSRLAKAAKEFKSTSRECWWPPRSGEEEVRKLGGEDVVRQHGLRWGMAPAEAPAPAFPVFIPQLWLWI